MSYAPSAPPVFPPLLRGRLVAGDPFEAACAATRGEDWDAGDLFFAPDPDAMCAALVFVPDRPVAEALAMVFACACGLNDAIGALAPPEVGVTHAWPDGVMVNGALAGRLRAAAGPEEGGIPAWLAVGVTVGISPLGGEPGRYPGITTLHEEGCAEITAGALLESWSRHALVWVNTYMDEGFRPLHAAWLDRAEGRGEEVELDIGANPTPLSGRFTGLDETGNLLLSADGSTRAIPLASMLDAPRDWSLAEVGR